MRDFLYEDGWGAFVILLFFHIPFLIFFCRIVYKKAFVNTGPSGTAPEKYPKIEIVWISTAAVLFILVNVLSLSICLQCQLQHCLKVELLSKKWI